jgi:biotin transport system substrate-specific component
MENRVNLTKKTKEDTFLIRRRRWMMTLTLVPLFTVLMCISAKLTIPIPVIPITLQVTVAIMSGLLLGARLGVLSQVLYVGMGLLGLPVFSSGGGIGYVFTGTFGYLLGFIFCAFTGGLLSDRLEKRKGTVKVPYLNILGISIVSLLVCYVSGVVYLYFLSNFYTGYAGTRYSFLTTLAYGALPFIGKDLLLAVLASELTRRLWRFRRHTAVKSSGTASVTGDTVKDQVD